MNASRMIRIFAGAFVPERLSGSSRVAHDRLNDHRFESLQGARAVIAAWRRDYNEHRPHSALGYRIPAEFAGMHRQTPCPAVVR